MLSLSLPSVERPRAAAGGGGRRVPYLHQGHLGAKGQQDLLGLGGVGVVPVLVEPLLEWPRHVLQRLPLVPHLPAALPRPAAEKGRSGPRPGQRAPARPPPPGTAPSSPTRPPLRVREARRDAHRPRGALAGGSLLGGAAPTPG